MDGHFDSSPFAVALAKLKSACPIEDTRRWQESCADGDDFVQTWGVRAAMLGWTSDDIFGLYPAAPLARYNAMGLIWLLHGRSVTELDAARAKIGNGYCYRRGAEHPWLMTAPTTSKMC